MSQTFSLICKETKSKIWIGQGSGEMSNFYVGEEKIMLALKQFLNDNRGKELKFICDEHIENDKEDDYYDFKEY